MNKNKLIALVLTVFTLYNVYGQDADYYNDGEILMLNTHTKGKGVPIVIVGDGFVREDLRKGGWYETHARGVAECFFKAPVVRDFKDYFDFYVYMAESKVRGVGQGVANRFGGDPFKAQALVDSATSIPKTRTTIFCGNGMVGGHAWLGGPVLFSTDEGANLYWATHELAGHGFSKLGDEYYGDSEADDAYRQRIKDAQEKRGTDLNVDVTDNPEQMIWKGFFGRPGYEGVGIFEGASYNAKGMWRAEKHSLMIGWIKEYNEAPHFTAQARYAVYKSIMEKAGEPFSFEEFLKYDVINLKTKPLLYEMPNPTLKLSSTNISAIKAAKTYSLKVKCNASWSAIVEPNSTDWCSLSPAQGKNNGTLKVTIATNAPDAACRSGYIFVRSGNELIVVRVYQDGINITVPKEVIVDGDKTYSVEIESNEPWTATEDVPWIVGINPSSGKAGKVTLSVVVENKGTPTPHGIVSVSAGNIKKIIKFEQKVGVFFDLQGRSRSKRQLNIYGSNMDENGQIADSPDSPGKYFRYYDVQAYSSGGEWKTNTDISTSSDWMFHSAPPCPVGFRVPTKEEITLFFRRYECIWRDADSGYGNKTSGIFIGTNHKTATISDLQGCIFLPASGYLDVKGQLTDYNVAGYYRNNEDGGNTLIYFDKDTTKPEFRVIENSRLWGASIRAVAF
jgi:hypothetical protein